MRGTKVVVLALAASLGLLGGCAVVSENVTYGPGLIRYPGYRVEYVEATPKPGTPLSQGAQVHFAVTVRYVLQSAPKGDLALLFRDQRGDPVLRGHEVSQEITRGTGTATLSQDVVVPDGVWDMWLWIPVIPEGVRDPAGVLRIRYSVVGQR
jgi:hypothetical protein